MRLPPNGGPPEGVPSEVPAQVLPGRACAPGLPLFPDADGKACTKAGVTDTIRVAAKCQGTAFSRSRWPIPRPRTCHESHRRPRIVKGRTSGAHRGIVSTVGLVDGTIVHQEGPSHFHPPSSPCSFISGLGKESVGCIVTSNDGPHSQASSRSDSGVRFCAQRVPTGRQTKSPRSWEEQSG